MDNTQYFPQLHKISQAKITLGEILAPTPLASNPYLSGKFGADVMLKREDLQIVRSYKIRGAYNKIRNLSEQQRQAGVVCASAGNHAQGVAFSCNKLGIQGYIYMPKTTPKQKIEQVRMFGNGNVEIVLFGDNFDEANAQAKQFAAQEGKTFIPPFDDPQIIEGQATIGMEILHDTKETIDYIFIPIGGGGLASGLGACIRQMSPGTKLIGVEPQGASGMKESFKAGKVVELPKIDNFVDGAAVRRVGDYTYNICKEVLDDIITVPEGAVCSTILEMYNKCAIVVEPAGALSVAALDFYKEKIAGKNVVCVISGSNNDITRMEEIRERSLLYRGLKHYFIVRFPQRAGALRSFITDVVGPKDDITHFSYTKKTSKERGPVVIGIELSHPDDFNTLVAKMEENGFAYEYLNDKPHLFEFLV